MKTKLFFFLITFLFAFGMKAQEDTIYFSNLDGEWSIVFDFQGKADTFDLTQNEQGQWFIVADFDLDGSLDTQAVAGPQVATPTDPEPPTVEPKKPVNEEQLNKWYLAVYGVLILAVPFVIGFVAPKWEWIKNDRRRDLLAKSLTIAIVAGFAIYQAGFTDVWQILLTWVITTAGIYDKGLKAFNVRTPAPANPTT